MKIVYLVLGILVGISISSFVTTVKAQNTYCDIESFIFFMGNNLEELENCINAPNEFQDRRIQLLQNSTIVIENRLSEIETKVDTVK